jgi:hypothetical protein
MKTNQIRFFSPQDNAPKAQKQPLAKPTKPIRIEGYISSTGKLVFPKEQLSS